MKSKSKQKAPTLTINLGDMSWLFNTNARHETNRRVKSARRIFERIKRTITHIDEAFDDFFRHRRTAFDVHWGKMLMDEVFSFANEIGRANGAALVRGLDPRVAAVPGFKEAHALELYLGQAAFLGDAINKVRKEIETEEPPRLARDLEDRIRCRMGDRLDDIYHEMDESWLELADKDRGPAASVSNNACGYSSLAHVQPIHYAYASAEETLLFYLRKGLPEHQLMLKVVEYHKPDSKQLLKIIGNVVKHGYIAFILGRELIRAGTAIIEAKKHEHSKSTDSQPSAPVQTRVHRRPHRGNAVA